MGKRNKYFMQSSSTPSFKTGSGGGKRRTIFGKIDLTGQMITKKIFLYSGAIHLMECAQLYSFSNLLYGLSESWRRPAKQE